MARFMVLYKSKVSATDTMANSDPDQMKEVMDAWMAWAGKCGPALVDLGAPVGPGKRVTAEGVSDADAKLVGYSVLEAGSLDEATALIDGHPHLAAPGDPAVVVMECLPIPGM